MMPRIFAYTRINHFARSRQVVGVDAGLFLGGPLRTHRVGFSFSGGVKSIDFPSPSSDVLEKETLD